jgi:L-2-hydroxyglutarate oxidase LhgO
MAEPAAEIDILIIGAGVVGLATAHVLADRFPEASIAVAEKNRRYGQETSSRSSEVIHAGIYYPGDSLKARLCTRGNKMLYEFCAEQQVDYRQTGKLIIAVEDYEIPALQQHFKQGRANGAELQWLDSREVKRIEPGIRACAAIWSPATGIIDSQGLMQRLYRLILGQGVIVLLNSPVTAIKHDGDYYMVRLRDETLKTGCLINCAGLYSDRIAALAGLNIQKCGYQLHYCKGEYYRLSSRYSLQHLIYPVPGELGLGIHVTRDLAGGQRLGPNTYYVDTIDYSMDETWREQFFAAASRYLPSLRPVDLSPDYAGIRPKLQTEQSRFRDFVIREESDQGLKGFINLIGIESPGLTSCLAIGEYVGDLVEKMEYDGRRLRRLL